MPNDDSDTDQLANLTAYTVFHIGVYITLGAAVIAGGTLKMVDSFTLRFSLICMLVAGACGGVIAGSIPDHGSWSSFERAKLGPGNRRWFTYRTWAWLEHRAFWLGVLPPAIYYLYCGAAAFKA